MAAAFSPTSRWGVGWQWGVGVGADAAGGGGKAAIATASPPPRSVSHTQKPAKIGAVSKTAWRFGP